MPVISQRLYNFVTGFRWAFYYERSYLFPALKFAGTHCTHLGGDGGTVRVRCFVVEHNTMSPATDGTLTARCGGERTKHEATAPPANENHVNT